MVAKNPLADRLFQIFFMAGWLPNQCEASTAGPLTYGLVVPDAGMPEREVILEALEKSGLPPPVDRSLPHIISENCQGMKPDQAVGQVIFVGTKPQPFAKPLTAEEFFAKAKREREENGLQ